MTSGTIHCPVCSSARVIDITGTLYECRPCGIAFNSAWNPKIYDDAYFLDEYKAQYGKTYLEDYTNIYALSRKRLQNIDAYINQGKARSDLSLLDIGSAAGFFLKCAHDSGIGRVTGIEISEYASRYCREHFHIPVLNTSFHDAHIIDTYDIVTAWFFIEHCQDPVSVIQRIYGMLNRGGVFAFSTPSIFGPMFKLNRAEWASTHPEDHRIDFSPKGIRVLLRHVGFRKIHATASGVHPERVLSSSSLFFKPFSVAYSLFSMLTAFSDTIEVYAVK